MANQLYTLGNNKNKVFPNNFIENIKDKESGMYLSEILSGFNCYFVSYTGSVYTTRLLVPKILRKKGLYITYINYDKQIIFELYNGDSIEDSEFRLDSNWIEADNRLVGELSISSDGYWVINGTKTEFKAKGDKGTSPILRMGINNKFQVSYNKGTSWEDISDLIVPKFRMYGASNNSIGSIQISMDLGKTWSNLSGDIANNLKISRYIGVDESLPTQGVAEGTIYI